MPANGKRVCIATLGCKVNQYDTNAMTGALADSGFTIVDWGEEADVCIVNTCTVTATADSKSRLLIHQAVRRAIPVCVCGCLAERARDELLAMDGVKAVVPMSDRARIAQVAAKLAGLPEPAAPSALRATGPRTRTRGFLKVQEGCNNACAYCIIPSVRGRSRTRPETDIVDDARLMAADGVQELVLSGIHISSYGKDNGTNLFELLIALSSMSGIERIRLGSLDPWLLDERTIEGFAKIDKLCPHFHVSLQSGCKKTLAAMNRRYSPEQYAERLACLREAFSNPAITTDVMTGFPGETADDFNESLDFVECMRFSQLHVFPYSERVGTKAAHMQPAVPVHVRKERASRMIQLGRKLRDDYAAPFSGTTQLVLFDRAEPKGASGYTDRYIRVTANNAKPGELRDVVLTERSGAGYTGTLPAAKGKE